MQLPASAGRSVAMDSAYSYLIDQTLKEAQEFQSPAVLEQVKQRWIERLQTKLAARATPTRRFPESKTVDPSRTVLNTSSTTNTTITNSSRIGEACGSPEQFSKSGLTTARSASVVSSVCETVSSPTQSRTASYTKECPKPPLETVVAPNGDAAEDDDEWASSEWQEACPETSESSNSKTSKSTGSTNDLKISSTPCGSPNDTATTTPGCDSSAPQLQQQQPRNSSITGVSKEGLGHVPPSDNTGDKRPGIVVECERDIYEYEDIDEATLSDLEDSEPECSDLIVSQFQSIQRPHARKTCQRGMWRIKLSNGIMQIDGTELFFKSLTGDLSF